MPHLGNLEEGSSTRDFERRMKGALEVWCLSLCGSSVKGTWREGFLAEDPEGYVEKALETGQASLSVGAPFGELGGGLVYQVL